MKTEIDYNQNQTQVILIDGQPYLLQPCYWIPISEMEDTDEPGVIYNVEHMREEIEELLDALDEGEYQNFFENTDL